MGTGRSGRPRTSRLSRRRFLQRTGLVAAAAVGIRARARAQGAGLKPVTAWIGVGAAEFMWHVLKGRKLDERQGLAVEVKFLDAHAINEGLLTGQTQIGATEPIPLAITNEAGRKFTFFAPELWNHTSLVVPAASPASSLKDLAGKPLGLLPPLSGIYTSTQVIAATMGLNLEKDFQIITGPPPALMAFLTRGDVDGIVFFEPFVGSLLLTGKYKVILRENQYWRQFTGGQDMLLSGLAADQSWLDANRDIAKAITAAILDTSRLIQSDPGVFDEYGKMFEFKTDEELESAKERLPPYFSTQWGRAEVASADRVIEVAAKIGLIKQPSRSLFVAL